MSTADPISPVKADTESRWAIAGLCLIVTSTILVEVCLTKFVSYKVFYHFVYAIISTVILSAGFAGTCVHLFSKALGKDNADPWNVSAKAAWIYGLTLILATVLFCWIPFDPYTLINGADASKVSSVALLFSFVAPVAFYFLLLSIPFFFAGVCVSCTLVVSKRSAATIYAYDLAAAALGALMCPFCLEWLGGYGTILAAATLAMGAYICYAKIGQKKQNSLLPWLSFAAAAALILFYPKWAIQTYGFDIRTMKNSMWHDLVLKELHGIKETYWNAVARIDVTNTGDTKHFETLTDISWQPTLSCRFILVDGAAPTRQLQCKGDLFKQPDLRGFLWSSPYIANPNIKNTLIIGPGGGVDILIGKAFKAARIDAVELNPSTYKHVLLGQQDSEADLYQPWLKSTATTEVAIHNKEARHYCTTLPPGSFDLIQATAVDTLTAITSGALSMVENYLYTSDAVKDYARLLKPGGILSLTHWRTDPPGPSVRMFVSYLEYLDSVGVKEPWKHVVVTGSDWWADEMMKSTPFTEEEVEGIRKWAVANKHVLLFDPYGKRLEPDLTDVGAKPLRISDNNTLRESEAIYNKLGFLSADERKKALAAYKRNLAPVPDDRPFFYNFERSENFFIPTTESSTPRAFVLLVVLLSGILLLLPLQKIKKGELSSKLFGYAGCFALAGFGFLLYETCIIQLFGVFVGGPVYSLCVVLVSVLGGYATGSWISERLKINAKTFVVLAVLLAIMFISLYLGLPKLIQALMPLGILMRIAICAAVSFCASIVTGIPVSLAMTSVKGTHGDVVAWMWGVSCASNAIGAMSFALIAQAMGVSAALLLVAALYFCANLGFALLCLLSQKSK